MNGIRGKRILLTRAADDCARWAAALEAEGATAVAFPCIVCVPLGGRGLAQRCRRAAADADWITFTSRRGIDVFCDLIEGSSRPNARIAVVGPSTAERAQARGLEPALVASDETSDSLVGELLERCIAEKIVHPRFAVVSGRLAGQAVPKRLGAKAEEVERIDVYETMPFPPEQPRCDLEASPIDAIWLASPSAVQGLHNRAAVPPAVPLIAIGPSTEEAIRDTGCNVAAVASGRSVEKMIEATCRALDGEAGA